MNGQERDLSLQRMTVERCLLLCALHADDDVAQHLTAVVLVYIIDAVLTQREAQHIGGHRLVAVLVVQLGNGCVVHEGHADLCRVIKVLIFQHGVAGAADEDAKARGNLDGFLGIGDQNFIGHKSSTPFVLHSIPWMLRLFAYRSVPPVFYWLSVWKGALLPRRP